MNVINRGELRGVVGKRFAMEDISLAHQAMEARDFFGKIVILGN